MSTPAVEVEHCPSCSTGGGYGAFDAYVAGLADTPGLDHQRQRRKEKAP